MVEAACESGGSEIGVELPLRYFPAGFLTIREYCGDAVMWGLFTKFSGARVSVPKKFPGGEHSLSLHLGVEGCAALVAAFGGSVINVPKCDAAKRALRDASIRARLAAGEHVNALAAEFGLTYRQVQKIGRGVLVEPAAVNFDLFD